ncbi:hypothetical protein ACFVAV_03810 [Nocardia sp. NPDC057663]|uniref:hypothetical protein n=1 Tax=Nocardia sp. NPDC057663 TaxID=3346201 RepID=UPI0036734AF3
MAADVKGESVESDEVEEFLGHRARLFALAYRMFGAAGEAEDMVHDDRPVPARRVDR